MPEQEGSLTRPTLSYVQVKRCGLKSEPELHLVEEKTPSWNGAFRGLGGHTVHTVDLQERERWPPLTAFLS